MKEQTDDLMDKAIKEKFAEHESSVPSHLWDSIESNLTPEKENPGGNFFFRNPFLLSILIIGTIAIGTYLYTTNETKDTATALSENKTTVTNNSANNTNTPASSVHATIEAETIQKETSQTSVAAASPEHTSHTTSIILSENKEKENASIHKNNNTAAATVSGNAQEKNSSSDSASPTSSDKNNPSAARNNATQNKADKKQTSRTAATDHSERSAGRTDTEPSDTKRTDHTYIANTASAAVVANNTNIHSRSINTTSSNNIASANTATRSMYADSIEQFTAAFIDKENTSTDTNRISTASATYVPMMTKQSDTNTDQIGHSLSFLNAAHAFSRPSDAGALHTSNNSTDKTNRSVTADQAFATARSIDAAPEKSAAADSATNMYAANSVYSGAGANSNNASAGSENRTATDLTSKIDSILLAKEIDSVQAENAAETVDATTTEETKKKSIFLSRCSIDGFAAPAFGYFHLSPGNPEDSINNFKERNKNSNAGLGFTTGLRMNYALTQKAEVGIGVQYSSLSQQSPFTGRHLDSSYYIYHSYTRVDSTYDSITHTTTYTTHLITDTTYANAFSTTQYVDKFQNISIPIHIAYGYSISDRFSLLARTSLLFNYQTYSVTHLNALDGTIVGYHSTKNISLGGSFSIGGYYQFSRACSVFAEPVVTYYFSNLFDNHAPFKQTQFLFGLQTGLRLSF